MMSKKGIVLMLAVVSLFFVSCNSSSKESKEAPKEETPKSTAAFSVEKATNDIKFIAYKTTEKVGVPGWFKEITVKSGGEGNSVKEAIHNTEFSIPVSSLFTKDTSRDYKIQKFFFGTMENTALLSGKLMISDDTNGVAEIKMNGYTREVPFTYTIADNTFNMKASIDVNNWNASKALAALNKVCEVLHTGADGVSKTWSEVTLDITSTF